MQFRSDDQPTVLDDEARPDLLEDPGTGTAATNSHRETSGRTGFRSKGTRPNSTKTRSSAERTARGLTLETEHQVRFSEVEHFLGVDNNERVGPVLDVGVVEQIGGQLEDFVSRSCR